MGTHKRFKYPRKLAPVSGRPRIQEEESVPSVEDVALDQVSPSLEELVAKVKAEGYTPIHWVAHSKGIRAEFTEPGEKIAIPSDYTKARVCMTHGNLVKLRQKTYPEMEDKGLRILDVLPCLFCDPQAVTVILRSPVTR